MISDIACHRAQKWTLLSLFLVCLDTFGLIEMNSFIVLIAFLLSKIYLISLLQWADLYTGILNKQTNKQKTSLVLKGFIKYHVLDGLWRELWGNRRKHFLVPVPHTFEINSILRVRKANRHCLKYIDFKLEFQSWKSFANSLTLNSGEVKWLP